MTFFCLFVFKESLEVNSLNLNAVCISGMLNVHESSKAFNHEIGGSWLMWIFLTVQFV